MNTLYNMYNKANAKASMTIRIVVVVLAAFAAQMATAQKIKGSDTVLPVSQEAAENYMSIHPSARVTVTGGGSGVGIAALLDGTTDIAMASRAVKFTEKMKLRQTNKQLCETVVAYDALAVVVNPANPVSNLTRQQLEDIFRGKLTNWNQVVDPVTGRRGDDVKIIVYSRETSSGTYEFFKTSVLKEKNVGMAYISKVVKAVKVSYDNKNFVYPSMATGRNHTYPIIRELYYYYTADKAKTVEPFINYLLSDAGQKIVMKSGYVPVK